LRDSTAPEYARFVSAQRSARRLPAAAGPHAAGQVSHSVFISARDAPGLLQVAARRAAGLFRPSKHSEVVWVEGDSELVVSLVELGLKLADGLILVGIPVRCDQTDAVRIEVAFACGSPAQPAGLYAAAQRRPRGPELIVATWGDALVAFAWHCLLDMVSGVAGATGKDERGNLLVPVEMAVSARGIVVVPMGRHRFAGSSGLKPVQRDIGKVNR
jgi:hypothetical protein